MYFSGDGGPLQLLICPILYIPSINNVKAALNIGNENNNNKVVEDIAHQQTKTCLPYVNLLYAYLNNM